MVGGVGHGVVVSGVGSCEFEGARMYCFDCSIQVTVETDEVFSIFPGCLATVTKVKGEQSNFDMLMT